MALTSDTSALFKFDVLISLSFPTYWQLIAPTLHCLNIKSTPVFVLDLLHICSMHDDYDDSEEARMQACFV